MPLCYCFNVYKVDFQDMMEKVGCTVPFFNKRKHVCTNPEIAAKALEIYHQNSHSFDKNCPKPCNYLKAFMIPIDHTPRHQLRGAILNFGNDDIQVTEAYPDYGELSMFADIGGYVGMFLGLSVSQLASLSNYLWLKLC